jgi:hypothetical protein
LGSATLRIPSFRGGLDAPEGLVAVRVASTRGVRGRPVLEKRCGICDGCRRLSELAHDLAPDWRVDPDFVVFGGVASESDHSRWVGFVLSGSRPSWPRSTWSVGSSSGGLSRGCWRRAGRSSHGLHSMGAGQRSSFRARAAGTLSFRKSQARTRSVLSATGKTTFTAAVPNHGRRSEPPVAVRGSDSLPSDGSVRGTVCWTCPTSKFGGGSRCNVARARSRLRRDRGPGTWPGLWQ